MTVIRGLHQLDFDKPTALTIGNFDGLHLGHQALLKRLQTRAKAADLPTTVMTFEPQPNEYFSKNGICPGRLMRLKQKILALEEFGIDNVVVLAFNQALIRVSAQDFVEKILVEKMKVKHVLVGDDFRFGYRRLGDINLLENFGKRLDFKAEAMPPFKIDEKRVSSTIVRNYLRAGNLEKAERLLGRPFRMGGRILRGERLGAQLGFPTANVHLLPKQAVLQGVFAVKVFCIGDDVLYGAANVGNRPTVDGKHWLLEVHILDFDKDIYGQTMQVEFACKLHDEIKYESLEELKENIAKDVAQVREYFKSGTPREKSTESTDADHQSDTRQI